MTTQLTESLSTQRNREESPGAFPNFDYSPEQSLPQISTSSLPYRYQITTLIWPIFFSNSIIQTFLSIRRVGRFLYGFKFQVESLEDFLKFECGSLIEATLKIHFLQFKRLELWILEQNLIQSPRL